MSTRTAQVRDEPLDDQPSRPARCETCEYRAPRQSDSHGGSGLRHALASPRDVERFVAMVVATFDRTIWVGGAGTALGHWSVGGVALLRALLGACDPLAMSSRRMATLRAVGCCENGEISDVSRP
jgi:hypothetical protein